LQNENGDNHNFCSKECYFEYRSKYYIKDKHPMFGTHQTEENKQIAKQRITQMISDGKMPQTMTKPHKIIYEMLTSQGIECENEYVLKYHSIDIYLKKYNLMIEIMGDYWHGIPLKYTYQELNKQQLKSVKQDKSKHTYTQKYHNVEILYLWERDINKNPELCWMLIQEYINKQGLLEDYNRYNYDIIHQHLQLKEERIPPYFITQNPYRLQEVGGNINLEVVLHTPLLEGNNIQSALTI
jgi:G:T-mismatch repair DNA endonuclease (very short patch repair protein)